MHNIGNYDNCYNLWWFSICYVSMVSLIWFWSKKVKNIPTRVMGSHRRIPPKYGKYGKYGKYHNFIISYVCMLWITAILLILYKIIILGVMFSQNKYVLNSYEINISQTMEVLQLFHLYKKVMKLGHFGTYWYQNTQTSTLIGR